MAEPNGTAEGVAAAHSGEVAADKGKGKATEPTQVQDVTMGEELSESDEESADEVEAVSVTLHLPYSISLSV